MAIVYLNILRIRYWAYRAETPLLMLLIQLPVVDTTGNESV